MWLCHGFYGDFSDICMDAVGIEELEGMTRLMRYSPIEPCMSDLLTHWGLKKRARILQTRFRNVFAWDKSYAIWIKF